MELKEFIQIGLERMKQATYKSIDGLTRSELTWQPKPDANSIGLILFHMARTEDLFVQSRIGGKSQIWESEKWYQKLNLPVTESGAHYKTEQIAAFAVPEIKDLLAYVEAVRAKTIGCLKEMTLDRFDKIVTMPRGDTSIGGVFALIIVHLAQHAGEISYLRGLQRGMDK